MNTSRVLAAACLLCWPLIAACNTSDPSSAVLANDYPAANDAGSADSRVVYQGWWAVARFADPVAPGQVSDPVRVVPSTDYGYALLAPGWDPSGGSPPATLIALRSAQKLTVARGDTLTFTLSDEATVGNCSAGQPLTQEDADFITQRIFPGEFANTNYDAAHCRTSPASSGGPGGADFAEGGVGGQAGSP